MLYIDGAPPACSYPSGIDWAAIPASTWIETTHEALVDLSSLVLFHTSMGTRVGEDGFLTLGGQQHWVPRGAEVHVSSATTLPGGSLIASWSGRLPIVAMVAGTIKHPHMQKQRTVEVTGRAYVSGNGAVHIECGGLTLQREFVENEELVAQHGQECVPGDILYFSEADPQLVPRQHRLETVDQRIQALLLSRATNDETGHVLGMLIKLVGQEPEALTGRHQEALRSALAHLVGKPVCNGTLSMVAGGISSAQAENRSARRFLAGVEALNAAFPGKPASSPTQDS